MPSQKPPPRTVTDRDQRWLLRDKYHGRGVSPTDRMIDRARLEDGEPLAYVIGWVPFLGQHIDLSARPLIPRLETEWWVAHVLAQFIAREKPLKILDLFAGSGCIGLGAASRLPTAQIHFGEIDRQLLAQIQQNWELNSLTNRHHIIETDVFSAITEQYDGIFANPPYCPPERWETLDQSVTAWEPKEAIVSPAGSNYFIEQLLDEIDEYLLPEGQLFCEFDWQSYPALKRWCHKQHPNVQFHKDHYGRWRYLSYQKPSRSAA